MLVSPRIKTVKPPDKKPGTCSDRSSFLHRRIVKFQFVWQKQCYNIPLAGLLQKLVGLLSRQSNISTSGEERFKYPLPRETKISQMPYPRLHIAVNPKAEPKKVTIKTSPNKTLQSFINVPALTKMYVPVTAAIIRFNHNPCYTA